MQRAPVRWCGYYDSLRRVQPNPANRGSAAAGAQASGFRTYLEMERSADRRILEPCRRGPALKPAKWPGGAVVAVALSFDYQMGTIYDDKNPASAVDTNSQYDGRVGLPRLLRLLDKYSVPASFFTTAVTAAFYPDTLKQIMATGRHEIGVHGWIHERNPDLPPDNERRLLEKSIAGLQAVTGDR